MMRFGNIFLLRDVMYSEKLLLSRVNHFPEEWNAFNFANSLREKLPAVLDKKEQSSCVCCAILPAETFLRHYFKSRT